MQANAGWLFDEETSVSILHCRLITTILDG